MAIMPHQALTIIDSVPPLDFEARAALAQLHDYMCAIDEPGLVFQPRDGMELFDCQQLEAQGILEPHPEGYILSTLGHARMDAFRQEVGLL